MGGEFVKKSIPTSGLSLIYYRPSGVDIRHTCAAIWTEHAQVRLVSPFLRKRAGILDPQPFIKKFPCASANVDAFERAMEWLDSVCYAAKESHQVFLACEAEPQWGLQCVRYDASDLTLGMGGLSKPLVSDKTLRREVARQCLLETVKRIIMEASELVGAQLDIIEPDKTTRDVANLCLPNGVTTRVSLLKKISSTDVIRRGILAMDRMAAPDATWQRALLVMPGLEIEQPLRIFKSVTICSLDLAMLRMALIDPQTK